MTRVGSVTLKMVAIVFSTFCSWMGVFCAARSVPEPSCRLQDIPLQDSFDLQRFQGKWYATQKLGAGDSVLSFFAEIYDARISFTPSSRGGYDIKAAGSKFYGSWCPKGKGHAAIPSPEQPERMTMFFDTRIGRQVGMKPGWILKTDYDNYAVIYSCWKEASNGECHKDSTYAVLLQRNTKSLAPRLQAEVDTAMKSACVEPRKLSKINHYGYCMGHDGL